MQADSRVMLLAAVAAADTHCNCLFDYGVVPELNTQQNTKHPITYKSIPQPTDLGEGVTEMIQASILHEPDYFIDS